MLRRPTLDEMNQGYTAVMIGWGAVVGSVISFLLSGAVLWAFVRLYQRRISFVSDRDVLWIGAAFALFFLAEALAGAIHYAGTETLYEVAENLPFLGFLFPYSRLLVSRRHDILRSVEIGVVSGAFATLAYAIIQLFVLDYFRAEGFAGNPGPFALIASVLYGVAFVIMVERQGLMRRLAVAAAIAAAAALLLSGVRILWPFLVVAPAISLVLFRFRLRASTLRRVAAATILSVIAIGFLTSDLIVARVSQVADDYHNIVENQDYENSLGYRLRLWRAAMELAAEQPIVGHGPGNERMLAAERTAGDGMPPISFSHFHNFVLNAMVRSGIVGLAALLFIFALPVYFAARTQRDEIANFGFAMMLVIEAAYLLSGSVGVMLGHDITDALFIYGMIVSSFLVLAERSGTAGEIAPEVAAKRLP